MSGTEVSKYQQTQELLHSPDNLKAPVREAISFIRDNYELLKQQTHLFGLGTGIDVLFKGLNPDLTVNFHGDNISRMIMLHEFWMAQENLDLRDNVTELTIETVGGQPDNDAYWSDGFMMNLETERALARQAGVYPIYVPFDHVSTDHGGTEARQILASLMIENWYNLSLLADKPMQSRYEMLPYPIKARRKVRLEAQELYQKAKAKGFPWQVDDLAETGEAVGESFEHNQRDVSVAINPVTKRYTRRDLLNPYVRIIRSSEHPQEVLFLDLPYLEIFGLKGNQFGEILIAKSPDTKKYGLNHVWTPVTNGAKLWDGGAHSPAYSISSGLFDEGNEVGIKLAHNGNSVTHIDVRRDCIAQLGNGHVYHDAAKAKDDAFAAGWITQPEQNSQEIAYNIARIPQTEISPIFKNTELPPSTRMKRLVKILKKARKDGIVANDYRDDRTLLDTINWLGLQDLKLLFDEIRSSKSSAVMSTLNKFKEVYHKPRVKALTGLIDSIIKKNKTLSDKGKSMAIEILVPKPHFQDIMDLSLRILLDHEAINDNSLGGYGLNHKGLPRGFNLNNQFSMSLWQNENTLKYINAPTYTTLTMGTKGWRRPPVVGKVLGAEALGAWMSKNAADYVEVPAHISRIATPIKEIKGRRVELGTFISALPNPIEQYVTLVPSSLEYEEKGVGLHIRPGYRVQLLPALLECVAIDDSDTFSKYLDHVESDVIQNIQTRLETRGILGNMKTRWGHHKDDLSPLTGPDAKVTVPENLIIFLETILDFESLLRDKNDRTHAKKALQILVATGIRRYCALLNKQSVSGVV